MTTLNIGDKAPDFSWTDDDGTKTKLSSYKGQKVVLYFYPKDDTPGCTKQACGFRDHRKDFEKLNTQVIGVSRDSAASHQKFTNKHKLNFPLVPDDDGAVCEAYGTWVEKSMYGKKYMGIERSTFVIDEHGKIAAIWRKVKVPGHVEDVAAALKGLKKAA